MITVVKVRQVALGCCHGADGCARSRAAANANQRNGSLPWCVRSSGGTNSITTTGLLAYASYSLCQDTRIFYLKVADGMHWDEKDVSQLYDECRSMQLDELELVAATFPEAELHGNGAGFAVAMRLTQYGKLQLDVTFPPLYPLQTPPVCTVRPSRQLSGSALAPVQGMVDAAVVATHDGAGGADCSALQFLLAVPELPVQTLGSVATQTAIDELELEPEPEMEPEPEPE
eukprot:COSAG02_NODE_2796_length_8012_cov_18.557311_1_plen_229_part_10